MTDKMPPDRSLQEHLQAYAKAIAEAEDAIVKDLLDRYELPHDPKKVHEAGYHVEVSRPAANKIQLPHTVKVRLYHLEEEEEAEIRVKFLHDKECNTEKEQQDEDTNTSNGL